jgi:hypothetical protein
VSKSAMPVSKAKTAYGLLSEIRKLILKEPRRYNQETWLDRSPELRAPCGTTACVAGWVNVLRGDPKLSGHAERDGQDVFPIEESATAILGITQKQASGLFNGDACGSRYDDREWGETEQKVQKHAKRGAAHIERFRQKYAKQLKAKRV